MTGGCQALCLIHYLAGSDGIKQGQPAEKESTPKRAEECVLSFGLLFLSCTILQCGQ
jgi:hypothetical protein